MKRGIYKNCPKCNKEFYIFPYLIGIKKYCSIKCHMKGEYRNCRICKKQFYALPNQIKRNWGFYCSRECYYISKKGKDGHNLGIYQQKGKPAPETAFKRNDPRIVESGEWSNTLCGLS